MRHTIAATLFVVSLATPCTFADDRAAVFIHGLGSSGRTWDAAVSRLAPRLAITTYQPDLDWRALYEFQATELEQKLGSQMPASPIAIGHSNGGVIARQWSRSRNLGAVITLGSPNQGVPFVDHVFEWFRFLDDILVRISNVGAIFANYVDTDAWWWLPAQWAHDFGFGVDLWNISGNGIVGLGFDYQVPVLSEMRAGSPFMANLNSQSSRDHEVAQIANRATIVNVARDFDHGGPMRVLAPDDYERWHIEINVAGIVLEGLATFVRLTADIQDQAAFDLADRISSVAEWFLQFEEVWCRSVSDPSPLPIARCMENDGIVPAWSMAYDIPRVPHIVRLDGPIHTQETADSDEQLYEALTTIAMVGRRPAPSPEPVDDPGGGNPAPDPSPGPSPPPEPSQPPSPPGRYKLDGWSVCYWEPNDYPPDQCSPPQEPTGRYKIDDSSCYWDPNDSGPDQCVP